MPSSTGLSVPGGTGLPHGTPRLRRQRAGGDATRSPGGSHASAHQREGLPQTCCRRRSAVGSGSSPVPDPAPGGARPGPCPTRPAVAGLPGDSGRPRRPQPLCLCARQGQPCRPSGTGVPQDRRDRHSLAMGHGWRSDGAVHLLAAAFTRRTMSGAGWWTRTATYAWAVIGCFPGDEPLPSHEAVWTGGRDSNGDR